jgi:predicted nucleic acid-binding Zn ribbon protein
MGGMAFESLHHVLGSFENQGGWQERQQFKRLLAYWPELVGPAVANQTKPVAIQRGVLKVATSSPAWAQNLIFERQRILEKLNTRLTIELTDIRFSTAQWHSRQTGSSPSDSAESASNLWQEHPSHVSDPNPHDWLPTTDPSAPKDPQTAFQAWSTLVQQRSQHLPDCPRCHCPTPPGELQRWSVCALCAAQQWRE